MGRHPRRIAAAVALALSLTVPARLAAQERVNPEAQTLADFNARVKTYLALRDKADNNAPKLQETKDAAKIKAAQQSLAAVIRQARAGARQGDIFAPAIEKKFRALLRPETKGPEGEKTKKIILDEKPAVALVVNADYPATEPLATVPPTVLKALPPLPEGKGLEYRFVRKHMILLDTRANLIVDYLLNAIP